MFSYGAAEPSLWLLQRFNLLEILLPFHVSDFQASDSQNCNSFSQKLYLI